MGFFGSRACFIRKATSLGPKGFASLGSRRWLLSLGLLLQRVGRPTAPLVIRSRCIVVRCSECLARDAASDEFARSNTNNEQRTTMHERTFAQPFNGCGRALLRPPDQQRCPQGPPDHLGKHKALAGEETRRENVPLVRPHRTHSATASCPWCPQKGALFDGIVPMVRPHRAHDGLPKDLDRLPN